MNVSGKDRKQDQIFLFLLFFFQPGPFHGQFSQDEPIIIPQRCLPPPNPMGGLSEVRKKEEKKRKDKNKIGYVSFEKKNYNKLQKIKFSNNQKYLEVTS